MPSLALARSVCARPERALTARAVTRRALCCCQARKARASRGAEEEHVNLSKTAALSQQGWLYAEQAAQHDSARQRLDLDEDSEEAAPWLDAVVKVLATHAEPDYSLPWQRCKQTSSTSSGFVVPGRLLLTNAHSVAHATQVRVKRRGDDKSFAARVLTIGAQCDCALLAVDDEDFWTVDGTVRDVQPLKLGRLPRLEDAVAVVGYPVGGDTLSVTRGVVSRIEITPYSLASAELLSMQIDAAINPGNSGGPVFNADGECVGIAFESLVGEDTENCGYAIPSPIVRHFVSDYQRHGTFTGFPRMGVQLQNMENEALRRAAGVPDGKKGVLVQRVEPTGGAADILEPGDVLHSYDGLEISNDGTIAFRAGQRIGCSFAMMSRFAGETVRVGYSRQGEIHEADVAVSVVEKAVPAHIRGNMPPFLVVAGLVFVEVTEAYLRNEYGDEFSYDAPVSLVQTMVHGMRSHTDEELVVVSKVLANEISLGYEHVTNAALKTSQGQPVRNLRHLTELVDETLRAGDTFLEFGLEQGERIVLSAHAVPAATTEVLEANAIPADRSADLPSPPPQQQ